MITIINDNYILKNQKSLCKIVQLSSHNVNTVKPQTLITLYFYYIKVTQR